MVTVAFALPVLRHHDDRRSIGRLRGKQQVQQNKGVNIPVMYKSDHVERHPQEDNNGLDDGKSPGAHAVGDRIGELRNMALWQIAGQSGLLLDADPYGCYVTAGNSSLCSIIHPLCCQGCFWVRILPDAGEGYRLYDPLAEAELGRILFDAADHWIHDGELLTVDEQVEIAGAISGHEMDMLKLLRSLHDE